MSASPINSILFVDDNALGSYGLVHALRQEGFHVLQASTGAEALQLLKQRPSLVILDVALPDMSGFEVCRRIKNNADTATIFVLHLSGHYVSSDDRSEALEGGADGYLIKPVEPRELIAHVKSFLRIRRAEQALHASEARLQHILDHAPVLVHVKDRQGRYLLVNRLWEQRFRYRREQIVGRHVAEVFTPELAETLLANDAQVLQAGTPLEFEETLPHNGKARVYLSVKFPLHDTDGGIYAVCGISTDITERKRNKEKLARSAAELRVARCIQQKLFPTTTPHLTGLDIGSASFGFDVGGASFPAEAVGGDYYDYLPLPDGSLGVAIGDVSGHGVGPALLMAEVRAYLRAFAQVNADPSVILRLVNRVIMPDIEDDRFITLLLGRLDPRRRTFVYASAGHTTGYHFNAEGKVKQALPSTSTPLGIVAECDFPAGQSLELEAGDLILFLTDGIVESRAPDGIVFGAERTVALLRIYRQESARQIVEELYHAVRAYSQDQPQYDDITATVIKVNA